ncbi:membrane protein [Pontibacillus halophilus JSM 076056 = DSM 19796]|uniref:Membrane protein n=1 Tax=Pontibacillus halophilus JSM 076056 = DSM 19796 TaxID=1385510 RepID=A0A0A5GL51_9BACI|nr:membrane protein [Pontibacillus halophilus JSM 076056 = DSM 19796]
MLSLASFRITRLLVYDTIMEWFRAPFLEEFQQENEEGVKETYVKVKGAGIRAFFGEMLTCHWCTGFWVTLGVLLVYFYVPILEPVLLLFAVSGAAALLFHFDK